MAERFELFRLSLAIKDQFDIEGEEFREFTREQWLRKVFLEEQPFSHYASEFHYVPALDDSGDSAIIGRVGRHISREENLPPDKGLADFTHDTWLASVLVLDPRSHDDGQKLAIQSILDVGKPISLVKELISAINTRYGYGPYHIEAGSIIESKTFWDFVEDNRGSITSVTFDFIAPNMFGSEDEFDREMREYRDNERARKVKLSIQNEDGIEPETERMRRAVDYASRSGGKISARAKGKRSYNSEDEVQRSYVDDVKEKGAELVRVAKDLADRILGRE